MLYQKMRKWSSGNGYISEKKTALRAERRRNTQDKENSKCESPQVGRFGICKK